MANIFKAIGDSISNHRRERMRGDIMAILKTEYGFDAYKSLIPSSVINASQRAYDLAEYATWYSANEVAIREFYKSNPRKVNNGFYDESLSYFWTKAPTRMRLCHSGLAREIAIKQDTILFGNGYRIQATCYKADANGNPTKDVDDGLTAKAQEIVDQMCKEVNYRQILKKGAQANSWSGHIAIKTAFKFNLCSYPVLMIYDATKFELNQDLGITTAIIFHNYLEIAIKGQRESEKYRHDEIYTTDTNGYGIIQNALTHIKNNKEETLSWEQAQALFPQFENVDEIFISKTKGMLAWDVPNIVVANVDGNNPYGQSDYAGAISSFDLVDECYSALPRELRDKRFIKYIPENRIQRDSMGNPILDDDFSTNYIKTRALNMGENETTYEVPPDETLNHLQKYNAALARAINACGFSPHSFGISGVDATTNSDDTLREKSRCTQETRNSKLEIWKPIIEKMIVRLLEFTGELQKESAYLWRPGIPKLNEITWGNTDVKVTFGDYLQSTTSELINTWGTAKTNGIASLEEIVKNVHPEWSEDEIDIEVKRIKFENGVAVDSPDNLLNEDEAIEEDKNPNPIDDKQKEDNK